MKEKDVEKNEEREKHEVESPALVTQKYPQWGVAMYTVWLP